MGRRDISEIRRAEYAAAAYRALMRHGNQGTSLARVAEEAGASKANVLHYFKTKEALLAAALRHANAELLREAVLLLGEARSPLERIYAVIETNLSPTSFRPEVAHAWIALCAGVPHVPAYQRIQTVIYARMRSNLMGPLRRLLPREDAALMSDLMTTAIDGIWLRCGLSLDGVSQDEARVQLEAVLDARLPDSAARRAARLRMREVARILIKARGRSDRAPA
ncbi:transcriptional regulator BetI [Phaeovulum vinaykumarii]|uniref:Transcriptional regulator, TetR family n=1 Tax=Phaeovulum vinaykumarii TaxID=407234 RepID=A0A1N7LL38_9RHOB|nr:transcriptional regulator BetI [Phaeovulum vinaykumarii]SIS74568.1 transcriptional regulator, TetR family [Phaeovulum vinaykumarii]SOC05110.1 TetR family transcriptional regulator [Phaeovulum vinaykumarii]